MSRFDEFLVGIQQEARKRRAWEILAAEEKSALGGPLSGRMARFAEADKEAMLKEAEDEAVGRVMKMLRKAAFPDAW